MKTFFILASSLFLLSFSGCTYGNEGNGAKLEDKDFNFEENLDSPEHMRRKAIMSEEKSFVAWIYRNTTEGLVHVCDAVILTRNEVWIFDEECQKEDPDQMVVVYKCHLRDQNNKAKSDYYLWGSVVKEVTPDKDGMIVNVRTSDPPQDCVIFTTSEAVHGSPPPNSPNYFTVKAVYNNEDATDSNLRDHDEL